MLGWLLISIAYNIFIDKDMIFYNKIVDYILMWALGFNLAITLFVFVAPVYGVIALKQLSKQENLIVIGFILSGLIILALILLRFLPYTLVLRMYFL